MKAKNVIEKIEKFASPSLAEFDFVGLLQGDLEKEVVKIGLTLDYSLQAINQAIKLGCQMLVTHHGSEGITYPLRGNNLEKIVAAGKSGLVVYRAHLNLDFCEGGIIDSLCQMLSIPAKPTRLAYQNFEINGGVYLAENYPISFDDLMARIGVLKSNCVRIAGPRKEKFRRIAITSGQGFKSEFFDQLKPDIYIAGEFEQEATKYAEDLGVMLVELSHHASEARPLELVGERLSKLLKVEVVNIEVPDTVGVI